MAFIIKELQSTKEMNFLDVFLQHAAEIGSNHIVTLYQKVICHNKKAKNIQIFHLANK